MPATKDGQRAITSAMRRTGQQLESEVVVVGGRNRQFDLAADFQHVAQNRRRSIVRRRIEAVQRMRSAS